MTDYNLMIKQMISLSESSKNYIPLLSNVSALIYENMKDLNWAGFYLVKDNNLLLGPFQGKVACVNIENGKGVCGTALKKDEVIRVEDVHKFPGHIACSSASRSEIVVPVFDKEGRVTAVLDIDSERLATFDETDQRYLEEICRMLS